MTRTCCARALAGLLLRMLAWEEWRPRRAPEPGHTQRRLTNLRLGAINQALLRLAFPVLLLGFAVIAQHCAWCHCCASPWCPRNESRGSVSVAQLDAFARTRLADMITRYSKIAVVWSVALFATLAGYSNLADYDSNFKFVAHVLSMDTTFPDNALLGRAITSTALHHAAYALIIAAELLVALLCWWGGARMLRAIEHSAQFNRAKGVAVAGLSLGVLLWFTGFLTVGGEWFLMWQSETYNGQTAAFQFAAIIAIFLVYLVQSDTDDTA